MACVEDGFHGWFSHMPIMLVTRWVSRQNTASLLVSWNSFWNNFKFFFFFFLNALAVKHETCTLTLISKANSSLLFHGVFAVLQVSGQNFIHGKFPRFNQRRINQNLIQDRPVVFVHGSLGRSVILWKNLWFSQIGDFHSKTFTVSKTYDLQLLQIIKAQMWKNYINRNNKQI